MAGNFWESSHYQQWLLTKDDLVRDRRYDLDFLSPEEYQKLNIFFANLIQVLGEQLKLRQQVIATATVYFKRFYVRNSFRSIDPLLMAPTCIFLASKVEEFGVISNSRLISTVTLPLFSSNVSDSLIILFLRCSVKMSSKISSAMHINKNSPIEPITFWSVNFIYSKILTVVWLFTNHTDHCCQSSRTLAMKISCYRSHGVSSTIHCEQMLVCSIHRIWLPSVVFNWHGLYHEK